MDAHVLLNLLSELGKGDKTRGKDREHRQPQFS